MLDTVPLTKTAIEVLNPTADSYGTAKSPLAPRIKSFEGKVVGLLWNGKAQGDVALNTVGAAIRERFPTADVRFYHGTIRFTRELLAQASAECDVIIGCAADCGACTSWLVHDAITFERNGVPTVTIASRGFERDCEATGAAFDMPEIRYVVVPRVYNAITAQQAEEQTRPIIDEIIRLATEEDAAIPSVLGDIEAAELTFEGDDAVDVIAKFNAFYLQKDWGDGYPLNAPTRARVEALLSGLKADRNDMVCLLPPGMGHATVEKVAINAAMAGCADPEEILVVMAALRAISKCPKPYDKSTLMSTGAHAPMILVNGPIAQRLKVNGARGCLGPGKHNEANLRIGRAVNLSLRNIGRWMHGVMDMDSTGTPRKFNLCLAENEADSPWEPYHVTRGFRPDDDTVTVFHTSGEWDIPIGGGFLDGYQLLRALAAKMPWGPQSGHVVEALGHSTGEEDQQILLINPDHAQAVADYGLSKVEAQKILHQHNRVRISDVVEASRGRERNGQIRPEWQWIFDLTPAEARAQTIPATASPSCMHVVVAGSHTPKPQCYRMMSAPVTEPVTAAAAGKAN